MIGEPMGRVNLLAFRELLLRAPLHFPVVDTSALVRLDAIVDLHQDRGVVFPALS
jgi:hypothetical protein